MQPSLKKRLQAKKSPSSEGDFLFCHQSQTGPTRQTGLTRRTGPMQ